ncbi:trypsin inhibitor A-like protein [Trifolium pratense]|uniref:Trypsin inhibitor A-like protein n=2 Tax=Trifolium pratense TaxID=57577 RepID=A0A2K3MQ14_TRIPR|nr:trypsin inhibitor A-like protein [Trifolium pratense]CAJ2643596.1 unnamed protein product [Trifolium pratense]
MFFLISLLVLFNTKPLQGAEPEPVVDMEGNPLQPRVGYYAWPLWANNGGIRLGETRNKTCPLDVIRDPNSIGEPILFTPPGDLDFIPTLTDLTIRIQILGPCVQDSRIWKITKVGADLWFVSTRGIAGDLYSKFKIVKLQGEHAYDIYSFEYCPSFVYGALCTTVGTFVDSDGTKVLALGEGIDEPYYFRFHKASTFPLEMYQDLSGV